jgi:hypothetical protein
MYLKRIRGRIDKEIFVKKYCKATVQYICKNQYRGDCEENKFPGELVQ